MSATSRRIVRFLGFFCLALSLLAIASLSNAQTAGTPELYYTFFDQKIPLTIREDAIAVAFKSPVASPPKPEAESAPRGAVRGAIASEDFSPSSTPLYLQLQQDLQQEESFSFEESPVDTRSRARGEPERGDRLQVEVSPLSEQYALVNLLAGTRWEAQRRIEAQPYVDTTLPVLQQSQATASPEDAVVLPNEIILSFAPGLSAAEKQSILRANNLEIVRPLRFTQNRYLVRSTIASGLEVLSTTNRLNEVREIQSATPNFIQTLSNQWVEGDVPIAAATSQLPRPLPMQWHLDSTPLATCIERRTADSPPWPEYLGQCLRDRATQASNPITPRLDIRAPEAWAGGNLGEGVVVAVVDSLIQWDHPDLIRSLYRVGDVSDKLPGEANGWDFVGEDPDTRIGSQELAILGDKFRDSFVLSAAELTQKYPDTFNLLRDRNPDTSEAELVEKARSTLANKVAGEFHGTMVAGVVAARPQTPEGAIGVAPQAKILPVRVMGLNGSFSLQGYLEAIAYCAARNVDIINISLGSRFPAQGEVELIAEVLENHPNLTIVASAGNDNRGELSFPAAVPGVIAVGATTLAGNRAPYSNYGFTAPVGQALTVVAPGGDNSPPQPLGRILTTGGTWIDGLWQNISTSQISSNWGPNLDEKGKYRWTQGTSFAAPAVAGTIALMKSADASQTLSRDRAIAILRQTASYDGLQLTPKEEERFAVHGSHYANSANQYFFGSGLVNAEAAAQSIRDRRLTENRK